MGQCFGEHTNHQGCGGALIPEEGQTHIKQMGAGISDTCKK